jgi:hypothetical protein
MRTRQKTLGPAYQVSELFIMADGDRHLSRSPVDRFALPASKSGYIHGAEPGFLPQ